MTQEDWTRVHMPEIVASGRTLSAAEIVQLVMDGWFGTIVPHVEQATVNRMTARGAIKNDGHSAEWSFELDNVPYKMLVYRQDDGPWKTDQT
jgi:hypothetical protein